MDIITVDSQHPDFIGLCTELDHYLDTAIGGFDKRKKYISFNQAASMDTVFLLYMKGTPVGCGALRQYAKDTGEVKRVFIREPYRGQHFSHFIMNAILAEAKRKNYQRLILETGEFLPASVGLYKSMGFRRIPNYPPYENMEESLCMEMTLRRTI